MANEYVESLDTLLKDTIPELPGVVREVARRELRLTFREFFARSYAWRSVIGPLSAPAGATPIQLTDSNDGDAQSDIVGITAVVYNATPLHKLPWKPYNTNHTSNSPTGFYMTSNADEFSLHPPLQKASTGLLEVHVALTPKLDAAVFPRQITSKFYDTLKDGFLARLYDHPNKPYSNLALAAQKRHSFRRAIGYHAAQAKQGYADAQAWSFPTGWR